MNHDELAKSLKAALADCRQRVDAFLALPAEAPFEEVVRAFDRIGAPLNGPSGRMGLFVHVHPDGALRAVCEELEQEVSRLGSELALHRGLWQRLKDVEPGPEAQPDEVRLHEHGLRDFQRSGVDRSEAERNRIRALQEELVLIGQEFDRNIVQGGAEFVIADGHAGLEGLPADFLRSHPEREDGSVVLSTDPTDRIPFLCYAKRGDLRRSYYRLSLNRAWPENDEVLAQLLAKRHELARAIGYDNWADYVTEDKMTKSAGEARRFLERVLGLVEARARAEAEELLEHKRRSEPEATSVDDSERMFLVEEIKRLRYGFDSQEARGYFPYARVKAGVLATSARLYGIEFQRREDEPVWHESVECYDIVDDGKTIARFFLDMHPRDDKYKHAAMFHLAEGVQDERLPEAALICNFPEPTDGDPALLLHDQVTTFFHEFGHLLHQLFAGRQRFLHFSGISTEMDFVEVPSQMYEEWAWNEDVLATFAHHHETGEPIPSELVARMRAADEYGKGLHVLRQLVFALLSLSVYDCDPTGLDVGELVRELHAAHSPLEPVEGTNFHAAFGHLNGYSAMYYTYMWSLVIAKDLYSRFEADPMDSATANAYRTEILEPGGSLDANVLVRGFLGRDYGTAAFERWLTS